MAVSIHSIFPSERSELLSFSSSTRGAINPSPQQVTLRAARQRQIEEGEAFILNEERACQTQERRKKIDFSKLQQEECRLFEAWVNNPLFLREFFSGRPSFGDGQAFENFYLKIREKIQLLESELGKGGDLSLIFPQIETVLKIEAKIVNRLFSKLAVGKIDGFSVDFCAERGSHTQEVVDEGNQKSAKKRDLDSRIEFRERVENLRQAALLKIEDGTPKTRAVRWILADETQRRFAAFANLEEVPYRFDEIPKAAVILFDPRLYLKGAQLKKTISIARSVLFHIKAFFCWIATGKRYTHAELSLGNGESFDLDKKKGCFFQGEMKIQSRGNKICYGAVMAANEEKMLKAHQDAFCKKGLIPFETFDDLWNAIDGEARRSIPLIEATFFDIIRIAFNFKRPQNYDSMKAWRPGEKRYGCSATTSALFSKFGIDIGKQFHKMDQNVAPADFLHSEYFYLL